MQTWGQVKSLFADADRCKSCETRSGSEGLRVRVPPEAGEDRSMKDDNPKCGGNPVRPHERKIFNTMQIGRLYWLLSIDLRSTLGVNLPSGSKTFPYMVWKKKFL